MIIIFKKLKIQIKFFFLKRKWRKINVNNETTINNFFDIKRVKVGNYSYGQLNVRTWNANNERLEIGSYCSIADDVVFLLGGNHDYHHFTTFPVKRKFLGASREATSKGKIVIGDDVWIGYRAMILSGVVIGQGAVIAAESVVTKSIEPYTIVGGNPAKVIKTRFNADTVKMLLSVDFNQIGSNVFKDDPDLINKEVDQVLIDKLRKRN